MPAPAVLEILKNSGIERLINFFERDAAGNFHGCRFSDGASRGGDRIFAFYSPGFCN